MSRGAENIETFESEDTVNYTNAGTMLTTSTIVTNGGGIILAINPGCGFNFDTYNTQSGLEQMAGNFYNAGSIRANSFQDLTNNFLYASTVGTCFVNATNIVIPGTSDVGYGGLMQLTGQNIDLTRGNLVLENQINGFTSNIYGIGGYGLDTNGDWDPYLYLGPTFAESSLPYLLYLPNSTPYFDFAYSNGGTNAVIRSAFVEDFSTPTIPINVYWFQSGIVGGGTVTVEWVGVYTNYATGVTLTNFLYLNNDYAQGASTNPGIIGAPGYPANFTFIESPTRLNFGTAATAGFPAADPFPDITFSNRYAYVTATLLSTTTATNAGPYNPSGALTNLPGRLLINASQDLTMNWANITQPNYLTLTSTNQFEGSMGANVVAPFSAVDLGVTNGFLTISNLLSPSIPVWSGTVDAWSTDFFLTNSLGGSNEYKVLIVGSYNLRPISTGYVQDLTLHSTNLVLCDALNVLRKLYIDAQNLTLTTNPIGNGATSPAGELTWINPSILLSNSLPNLLNLTNDGIIQGDNLISLGTAASPLDAVINNGGISDTGTALWAANFENSGTISNGTGAFQLNASTVTLTNGSILALDNKITIAATTIEASNVVLDAGSALTLTADALSDGFPNGTTGLTNGNVWSVGADALSGSPGIYLLNGFNLPFKPLGTGLLGTTVTNIAPPNKLINNLWAAEDYGASNTGYTNNAAVGQLILDAQGQGPGTQFYFSGTGVSNAIYVDRLVLAGGASYTNHIVNGVGTNSIPALGFNTNLVIYYADAVSLSDGSGDVSFQINGFNNNHLRWVPTYTGYFSATNIVYPNGTTNTFNVGLAESKFYSSNGSGVPNAGDPTPFFVASEMGVAAHLTNNPAKTVAISWNTVPFATNFVYYSTNLLSWQLLTNSYSPTNGWFVTPTLNPGPATNIMILDPITGQQKFYQVIVSPDLLYDGQ